MKTRIAFMACVLAVAMGSVQAADRYEGFLCCNMRTTGDWISDINYEETGKHVIPVGTPLSVLGPGRHRLKIKIEGRNQAIGNEYSRDLSPEQFEKRYVVLEDPNIKIGGYPRNVQESIRQGRIMRGMNREQVLMALGYPVSSENPNLAARTWNYWLFTWLAFKVRFDEAGLVEGEDADSQTRGRVLAD